eukprot:TRINITY_DN8837_c0_g1_i1.p1 TRINITY_DN8837_c0_g1~~TRINITY_DN8837_c0_g1_i1.p1  ORF type:complete len:294 (-),score=63.63 TRINITY_DN8837_c0_g1_i1:106-987(-)
MAQIRDSEDQKAGLEVYLHPLVLINASDHYTRTKVKENKPSVRAFGILLGVQNGRRVEITNSFETIVKDQVVDTEYVTTRKDQIATVWSGIEILGWYSTGKLDEHDMSIHQQMEQFNESPLYLLVDTQPVAKELPVTLLETTLKSVDDKPKLVFTKVPFKIETTEAERIAVDHVANVNTGGKSLLTAHLSTMSGAIKMLSVRVKFLSQFLKETKSGNIPRDESILRSINSLCHLLPSIEGEKFQSDFFTEYNDALLVTYLASITKSTNAINEMIEKFNVTFDRQGGRRRGGFI